MQGEPRCVHVDLAFSGRAIRPRSFAARCYVKQDESRMGQFFL